MAIDKQVTKVEIDRHERREMKFVFDRAAAGRLVAWLSGRCRSDPEFPEGIVSSIYYDTRNWKLLEEKTNSDYLKTKIRVRWYADIETGEPGEASFLEVKRKEGGLVRKTRIPFALSGRWLANAALNDSELLVVRHHLRGHAAVPAEPIFPAFVVRYKRVRFVEPITCAGLCVDWDIGSPRVNAQLLPAVQSFILPFGVFEVKGDIEELPPMLHGMTALGCRKEAVSKYLACYRHILRRNF